MADADALLREGDLSGARAALVEVVRSRPGDPQARMFLFQLLAVAGEWDKAKKALETLVQISPEAQMLAVAYGQAIECEAQRARVFAGQEPMPVLANADGWAGGVARAISLFAQGQDAAAAELRDVAFDDVPDMPCHFNDEAWDWIADGDSRFGPTFEAIVGGRYGLLPFDAVERISCEGVRDLRDVVWLPVEIDMRSGQSISGFIPARYPGSERSPDPLIQLGRSTQWQDHDWGQTGLGQRLWGGSGEEDRGLLGLRSLEFG